MSPHFFTHDQTVPVEIMSRTRSVTRTRTRSVTRTVICTSSCW